MAQVYLYVLLLHFVNLHSVICDDDAFYEKIIVQEYKFVSNEYRVFPLHFEYNFCKGWKHKFAGLRSCAEKCGNLNCPLKKNVRYFICNCLMDESKMPPLMPTGRFELALEGIHKNVTVFKSETYIEIYRPIPSGRRFG